MKSSCDLRDSAAQRQVRHGHGQRPRAIAEARHQHAATLDAAGQGMVLTRFGSSLLSRPLALEATPPMRGWAGGSSSRSRRAGQVVGLVGEARAQAARDRLLQADDVVAGWPASAMASRLPRLLPAGSACDQLRVT
jgi:hypothetical protein